MRDGIQRRGAETQRISAEKKEKIKKSRAQRERRTERKAREDIGRDTSGLRRGSVRENVAAAGACGCLPCVFRPLVTWLESTKTFYVPDFSNWKDHDSYQKEVDRLLRDLKAEENQKVPPT